MTGYLSPVAYPRVWDVVSVGTVLSPGYCVVTGWKRSYEWDVKKGKGTIGGTSTFVQTPPAEGEITIYLWDDGTLGTGHDHFLEWALFQPLLQFDPTKKTVTAITIYHPVLLALGITSVVCDEIGQIETDKATLMSTVTCKFHEYFPPATKSAVGTAKASSSPHKIGKADALEGSGELPGRGNESAQDADAVTVATLWDQVTAP